MRSPDFGIVAGLAILVLLCASLPYMSICTGVVVSVAFQQVNGSPDAEAGTEGDDEGLENADSRVEKFHICVAGIIGFWLC